MSSTSDPVPQRIGDAERDQAATYLREALAQGRLEPAEFDERLDRALRARTESDLEPLFKDLPGPKPGQELSPAPGIQAPPWQPGQTSGAGLATPAAGGAAVRQDPTGKAFTIAAAVAWPLTIMLCFIVGWEYWWLVFLPIMLSSLAGKFQHDNQQQNESGGSQGGAQGGAHGNPHGNR